LDIKCFNKLPLEIKNIAENPIKFKANLKEIPEYTFILYIGGILQYLIYEYANIQI
jgi:hypothetical protein